MTTIPSRGRLRQTPEETRILILDAAERTLRERPYREVSVDELMRATGYGRTVFYRHFTGMPDLVLALLGRVLPEFVAANEAFVAAADQAMGTESIRALLHPAVTHWSLHGPLLRAVRDASVYDAQIEAIVVASLVQLRTMTRAALERRRSSGYLANADLDQLAAALAASTQRYLLETYGEAHTTTVSVDVATDTLTLIWDAVLHTR